MRKLNFLRKSERKSVGTTLALTVGSPSAHRRYSALKHLAFMLLFLLGSLNVWGADPVSGSIVLGNASGAWDATTTASFTDENDLEWSRTYSSNNKQSIQGGMCQFGNSSNPCTSLVLSTTIGSQVTLSAFSANFTGGASKTSGTIKLYSGTTELASATVSGTASVICEIPSSVSVDAGDAIKVEYTGTNGSIKISGISYTYTSGGGGSPEPGVLADPAEVENVAAEGVTNQTIDLTYENIENYVTEVSVHPNADGTGTLSPAWLTASVSDADNYATVTYSVTANEGAARTAYIKVYTTDGENEAEKIIPVSQVKYEAPFEGKILEINGNDFNTTSYAANNGNHTKNCVVYNTTAVMKNSNDIQFQKSNGLMYNKTDLGEIAKIEITKTGDYNLSVYEGTEEQPTTAVTSSISGNVYTYTFSNSNGYFKIKCGGTSLSKVNPIKVYYTPAAHAVTLSAVTNGTLTATVDDAAITSGDDVDMCKTVTIAATPNSGYKLKSLTVTDEDDEEVEVTSNQFVMPAKNVTIAAVFEETKTLTGITLTGEYPTVFLTGDAFSHEGMTVTANYDDETSANVTDEATFTGYNMSAAGVQTVTVSYTEGATVTKTYDITVKDAYTVTEILPLVPAQNAGSLATKVKGYISQIDQYNSSYNSITYWISDDGKTTSDQLEVYSGKNVGNTNFYSIDDLEVGDFVTITGNVKTHTNGVKEFDKNNYIITGGRIQKGAVTSVAVSGNATKTTYSANETFETAGLVVTATYDNGFSEVVTEGITWDDDLTEHKVAESTTVQVTATVGGVISAAYGVAIEVSTKALVSIALSADEFEVYQGLELPKPTVTATYSEGEPEDVTALADFTGYDKTTPGEQIITVSYSFGGNDDSKTYTVTVKPIYNVELAASVARDLIINSVGSAGSGANEMIIRGIVVNPSNPSSSKQTYYISDDGSNTNTVEIFKGLYIDGANFTASNKLIAGDEVVVKGAVTYYQSSTPEFSEGSILQSLARTPNFEIEAVTGFEVGSANLAVGDLTITQDGEGAVTLASSNNTDAVTIVDGNLHAVAAGTATITANLAADGIYKAATYEFSVTVIPAQIKYAITFDGNGADGGDAPEAIENKAAGAEVTLPANSYTKTGHTFDGWKVINNTTTEEVEVTAGAFEMPASAVTIQAQWAEISVWATTYTSNLTDVNNGGSIVKFHGNDTEYNAIKAGTGKAAGSTTITVPAQATKLHFHAYGWNGESVTLSITAPAGVTVSPASQAISANTGISGSTSTYTLAEGSTPETDAYYAVNLSGNNDEIELTISATSGNRFVLFGVNQEGGLVPVLDHIVVTGTATALEYEVGDVFNPAGLGANAIYTLGGVEQDPVAIDAEDIEWSFEPATIAANTTAVTVTATYEGQNADKEVTGLIVSVPEPEIIVSAASLAFGNKAKGVAVDDKELTVTLKSVENATLTITGDGASAFSVTPAALTASGTVAVSASSANVGTFNATLTISDDAANGAEPKEVALSITVEASDDLSGTWNLVTDAADLMAGMQVIIANVADENAVKTMGQQNSNNRAAVASTVAGTVLTPAAGTKVFTLVDAGNGKFAFQAVNGSYLYASSSTKNYLIEKATNDANGQWTISIADGGVATITAQGTNTHKLMRYNPNNNSPLFACYETSSTTGTLVTLYAKAFDYSREIAQGVLSTTCLPNGGQIFGASIFEIAYMDYEADGTTPHKIYFDEVEGGIMEAGIPYVVLANEDAAKFGVYYTDSENKAPQSKKGLVGYIGAGTYLEKNDYFIYNNMFYYVSEDDATNERIHISNNRAYINLSQVPGYNNEPVSVPAPGRRRVSLGNGANAPQVATGIENTGFESEAPRKVLINGELFIIRGEKMYDAKGQLVK